MARTHVATTKISEGAYQFFAGMAKDLDRSNAYVFAKYLEAIAERNLTWQDIEALPAKAAKG
jgi:hypothetical protein